MKIDLRPRRMQLDVEYAFHTQDDLGSARFIYSSIKAHVSVSFQLQSIFLHKGRKVRTPDFLLTFEEKFQVDRQFAIGIPIGFHHFDQRYYVVLRIRSTTR